MLCRRLLHFDVSTSTVGVTLSPCTVRELSRLSAHLRSSLANEAVGPAMARRIAAMQRPQQVPCRFPVLSQQRYLFWVQSTFCSLALR